VQIAALAIRTGISPRELAACDGTMLDAIIRVLDHQGKEQRKALEEQRRRR